MKSALCGTRYACLTFATLALFCTTARAEGDRPELPDTPAAGFTVLSNATNVTHWGLGAGAAIEAAPYRGYGAKFTPIPVIFFDDKWVHVFGTSVDLKVGQWAGVNVALRGEYGAGDRYHGSDAPILNGMQNRNATFWYGPAFSWHSRIGTLSGEFLLGGNRGEKAAVNFSKAFPFGAFSIEPHVGVDWRSSDYVDYYFGVRPSEARADRPAYGGTSTWNASLGTRVDYRLSTHQRLMFDVGVSHLGSGITDSPLVGKRFVPQARVAYLYQFK